ncbi:MAG: NAD(P)/FAD-dependent oxidoreductase [Oscillospiraceae bacterium]|nr:NAD(P)/FAD-dependent oxidoreductase [Oscillospiraceae bacterium]
MERFDVLIVGAGAVGCAAARELSRYRLRIGVLEKEYDVAAGTSGRNSAVVHAGFNNAPGSLMAQLCVEGSRGFGALCRELDVPLVRTGKVLVSFSDGDTETLRGLIARGERNGCEGLRLLDADELRALVPGIGGIAGMLSPRTSVFDPFLYAVALAENAAANGAAFFFGAEVLSLRRENGLFTAETPRGDFSAPVLVNAAGLASARIAAMAGAGGYRIYPCRGEYLIFEGGADLPAVPVYPAPRKGIGGLGVHLTPTTEGDVLVGPSAEYLDDPEDTGSTAAVQARLADEAVRLLPALAGRRPIASFCGIRAKQAPPGEGGFRDFVIRSEEAVPGLIDLIGIESPGLTASAPIARRVAGLVGRLIPLTEDPYFDPIHRFPPRFRELDDETRARFIAEDPAWGEIVCRCRLVTRREIADALNNPLGVRTLTALKYRTRAATGRCQSGYCLARIADVWRQELGLQPEELTLRGPGSELFAAPDRSPAP